MTYRHLYRHKTKITVEWWVVASNGTIVTAPRQRNGIRKGGYAVRTVVSCWFQSNAPPNSTLRNHWVQRYPHTGTATTVSKGQGRRLSLGMDENAGGRECPASSWRGEERFHPILIRKIEFQSTSRDCPLPQRGGSAGAIYSATPAAICAQSMRSVPLSLKTSP